MIGGRQESVVIVVVKEVETLLSWVSGAKVRE